MFSKYFRREEIERAMCKCLSYGDEHKIADACDAGYGLTTQYLDPNNDRESPLFRAAAMLTAWIDVSCVDGQRAFAIFQSFVGRALPCSDELDVSETRKEDFKESMEFRLAEVELDLDAQIKEGHEAVIAMKNHVAALEGERERQRHRAMYPNERVSHTARVQGQKAVANRRAR